jgi:hypothetical protein
MRIILAIGSIIIMLACYVGIIKCWLRIADMPEEILKDMDIKIKYK